MINIHDKIQFNSYDFHYFQDFRFPKADKETFQNVIWDVKGFIQSKDDVILTAPNHGGEPYGNGSIFVNIKDVENNATINTNWMNNLKY